MRLCQVTLVAAIVLSISCGSGHDGMTAAQAVEVDTGVRTFARTVAHDVAQEGPAAWRRHFSDSPSFFMAANGYLQFPNSAAATAGIQELTRNIKQVELRWGDDLRVAPLEPDLAVMAAGYDEVLTDTMGSRVDATGFFTGIAEYRNGRWQFRNAHWSEAVPLPAVP